MDSKLEKQRSVIKLLLLEGQKPCDIFQSLQKSFFKACISRSTCYSWVSQFRERRTSMRDKPRPGRSSSFVCVEVLRPSQPNEVMSSAVSLPNHTFTGQA